MTAADLPDARRIAYRIVLVQAALTAIIAVACQIFGDTRTALSAAVGGGIGTAASLVLVVFAFRSSDQSAKRIARAFFVGEAAKFALVIVLFVLAFSTMKKMLVPGALLGTYVATILVHGAALLRAMPALFGPGPQKRS